MTTRLQIYNGALLLCGEARLSTLSENREPRHLLDLVWNDDGVRKCLEMAQWKFAMRAAMFTYDPDADLAFGYTYACAKPADWVATSAVCSDERFNVPLLQYKDERGYWFSDLQDIYVRYVSDDTDYGANLSGWTGTFTDYVEAYFAQKIVRKLPGGAEKVEGVEKAAARFLKLAKNKDAMADPPKLPPLSAWPGARIGQWGRRGPMGDGGNPGSLTG